VLFDQVVDLLRLVTPRLADSLAMRVEAPEFDQAGMAERDFLLGRRGGMNERNSGSRQEQGAGPRADGLAGPFAGAIFSAKPKAITIARSCHA
jgi:hypothetical protein